MNKDISKIDKEIQEWLEEKGNSTKINEVSSLWYIILTILEDSLYKGNK